MNKAFTLIIFIWLCLSLLPGQISQELVGVDSLTVGSRFKLIVKADFAINRLVVPDSLGDFSVVDSFRNTKEGVPFVELTIVPLKTGALSFPQLEVEPVISSPRKFFTDRFRLSVLSVRPESDEKLRDIKDPKRYKYQVAWWTYLLALILAVSGLALLFIRRLLSGVKPERKLVLETKIENRPPLQAWELALQRLRQLRSSGLLDNAEWVEFYFRLSQIIREYLEQEFNLSAMEMTTREIIRSLALLPAVSPQIFGAILQECDLIKFAKKESNLEASFQILDSLHEYFRRQDPSCRLAVTEEE